MAVKRGAIWLVVGESGSGKTTFCRRIVAVAQQMGLTVRGLICPARFEGKHKVGIEVLDLASGEQRVFGWHQDIEPQPPFVSPAIEIGEWRLQRESVEWGNWILSRAVPCDMLVVDELGPLEFERGEGWQAAFAALDRGDYRLAFLTVRPSLRMAAHTRWKIAREIELAKGGLAHLTQANLQSLLIDTLKNSFTGYSSGV